jgi:hypothetical protein
MIERNSDLWFENMLTNVVFLKGLSSEMDLDKDKDEEKDEDSFY